MTGGWYSDLNQEWKLKRNNRTVGLYISVQIHGIFFALINIKIVEIYVELWYIKYK